MMQRNIEGEAIAKAILLGTVVMGLGLAGCGVCCLGFFALMHRCISKCVSRVRRERDASNDEVIISTELEVQSQEEQVHEDDQNNSPIPSF